MILSNSTSVAEHRPVLIVPYLWIGDFVRCHSIVKLINARWPARPVDVLTSPLCAPLIDYMPGVRQGIVSDLPRGRIAFASQTALARRLRREQYQTAMIMPRTWKSALAPFLAGIPERIGFAGEARFGLINDLRWGESKLERMIDRCAALTLPRGAALPSQWPLPELAVPAAEITEWRQRNGLNNTDPVVALAPGAVGPSKRWPIESYAQLTHRLAEHGIAVWVLGGPDEKSLAAEIIANGAATTRDLTGPDLRNAILALAAASVAVSNDSGLLHVAAALGTASIGIFGPTSPWHWAPLNPLTATIESQTKLDCRPCHKPVCRFGHHLCMHNIPVEQVFDATQHALATLDFSSNSR